MTEHEKFNEIIDLIGYELDVASPQEHYMWKYCNTEHWIQYSTWREWDWNWVLVNLIEIIFTPKFMDKYKNYLSKEYNIETMEFDILIMKNLHAPVSYLYYMIKLWTKK